MKRISRLIILLALLGILAAPAVAGATHLNLTSLVGTWHNTDPNTKGIVKLIITDGAGAQIRAFSACEPDLCDWGTVSGTAYGRNESAMNANALIAVYDTAYGESVMTGSRAGTNLRVEVFTKLKDGGEQSARSSTGVFVRE